MKTKEKFLHSALKLFAAQGIDKTSTTQITEDMKMSSGSLFRHYKTKQELIDTLYLKIKKDVFGNLKETIDPKAHPKKTLQVFSKKIIEHFINHYDEFIFMELVENDPQVSPEAIKKGQAEYKWLVKEIQKWKKENYLKDFDLNFLGNIIWTTTKEIIKYHKTQNKKKVQEKYFNLIWESIHKTKTTSF